MTKMPFQIFGTREKIMVLQNFSGFYSDNGFIVVEVRFSSFIFYELFYF